MQSLLCIPVLRTKAAYPIGVRGFCDRARGRETRSYLVFGGRTGGERAGRRWSQPSAAPWERAVSVSVQRARSVSGSTLEHVTKFMGKRKSRGRAEGKRGKLRKRGAVGAGREGACGPRPTQNPTHPPPVWAWSQCAPPPTPAERLTCQMPALSASAVLPHLQ